MLAGRKQPLACRPLRHGVLKDFPKGHLKVLEQRYGAVNPCFKGLEFGNGDGMEIPKITQLVGG